MRQPMNHGVNRTWTRQLQRLLLLGCVGGSTVACHKPPATDQNEQEIRGVTGGWGSNCTIPELLTLSQRDDFGHRLFVGQWTDFSESEVAVQQDLYFDPNPSAVGADVWDNLNAKFHHWGAQGKAGGWARTWVSASAGGPVGGTPATNGTPYDFARGSLSLLGQYLTPTPSQLSSQALWPLQTYLLSTLQKARVPKPSDPTKTSAVVIKDMLITDGIYQVPVGAMLSCLLAESVNVILRDSAGRPIRNYTFSGTVWPDTPPAMLISNLPQTFPMPPQTADLKSTYRIIAKPPAPNGVGPSAEDARVFVAGSAFLDRPSAQSTYLMMMPPPPPPAPLPIDPLPPAPPPPPPHTTTIDSSQRMLTRIAIAPPPQPVIGPPSQLPYRRCFAYDTSGIDYRAVLDDGGRCGSCASDGECVSVWGADSVCLDAGVSAGGSPLRSCAPLLGCTPSQRFDYAMMTAYLDARALYLAHPEIDYYRYQFEMYRSQLDVTTVTPRFTCYVPKEMIPVSVRSQYRNGAYLGDAQGVLWCAGTDYSDPTQYNLQDQCGVTDV
jgi:hypothetical protein